MKKSSSAFVISLALLGLTLYTPVANSQVNAYRKIPQIIKNARRLIRKNIFIKPNYKIVQNSWKGAAAFVATVQTANGMYQIYIDCRQGIVSKNIYTLPSNQRVSLYRDVCRKFL